MKLNLMRWFKGEDAGTGRFLGALVRTLPDGGANRRGAG